MDEPQRFQVLWFKFTFFFYFAISSLIDLAFIVVWIRAQDWFHDEVLVPYKLEGVDEILVGTLQTAFGLGTTIPVLAYILIDVVRIMISTILYLRHLLKSAGIIGHEPTTKGPAQQPGHSQNGKDGSNGSSSS